MVHFAPFLAEDKDVSLVAWGLNLPCAKHEQMRQIADSRSSGGGRVVGSTGDGDLYLSVSNRRQKRFDIELYLR